MKKTVVIIFLCLISFSLFGQNQLELNKKARYEYQKADKELNKIYQKILQDYKSDIIFLNSMKEAQRQWIRFRDAQLKMKYPPYKDVDASVLQMCKYYYLKDITTNRIKELKQWTDGIEEGDICCGSIKIKQ